MSDLPFTISIHKESNHPSLVSRTASPKAFLHLHVSKHGRPYRANLDVTKFLVLHAKLLCLSNEKLFLKAIDCALDPLYDLLREDCKEGCSIGTTGLDLMPGGDSITVGQGMPFRGSLASLTLEKPCIVLQNIGEKLKVK